MKAKCCQFLNIWLYPIRKLPPEIYHWVVTFHKILSWSFSNSVDEENKSEKFGISLVCPGKKTFNFSVSTEEEKNVSQAVLETTTNNHITAWNSSSMFEFRVFDFQLIMRFMCFVTDPIKIFRNWNPKSVLLYRQLIF